MCNRFKIAGREAEGIMAGYVREEIPVFIITGFLESGKTSFLEDTLKQDYFQIRGTTLVIACEEGEEEYHKNALLAHRTAVEYVEDQEDFTLEKLEKLQRKYCPQRVMIEYNPLWSVKRLWEMKLPEGWSLEQQIVTIDAGTYDVYVKNMKSLFVEMSQKADMMIFNRCKPEYPLASFRRGVKVVNPGCEVVFEMEDGQVADIFEDAMPYDVDKDPIEIEDVDYGIFYVDLRDNPERYVGKNVVFKGRVLKSKKKDAPYFVPSRKAMTCCADDTQYLGYVCKYPEAPGLKVGQWVMVKARVAWEKGALYRGDGPVFYAREVELSTPPKEEMVYFN